ncbi:hypothetical protein RHGRI_026851 [Rhododendron griersonianum]|uniref:TF-B3 domain-containing protein n=1 Tax=Rhododendron griersonianum TaxID=479676 RepID=A0AAV6IY72_9ERIC|nr:hypothetical protein RHGRI_026851 [Rhododendron griersonianum]
MARCTPFVRCRYIETTDTNNNTTTVFNLINISGDAESIATVTNRNTNTPRYRAHDAFVEQYSYLHNNGPTEWMFEDDFQDWVAKLQYYSFVEQRLEMTQPCWFFKWITDDTPFTNGNLAIPETLRRVLQADNNITWILFKNQARVWPVQIVNHRFGVGWTDFFVDNQLMDGYQIVLASETMCIFEVLIFNKEHTAIFNTYSNQNDLPAPFYHLPAVLKTSCFPRIWFDRTTICEFAIGCHIEDDIIKDRLEQYFEHDCEQQIVFALQEHEWTIPVLRGAINEEALEDFIGELDLSIALGDKHIQYTFDNSTIVGCVCKYFTAFDITGLQTIVTCVILFILNTFVVVFMNNEPCAFVTMLVLLSMTGDFVPILRRAYN